MTPKCFPKRVCYSFNNKECYNTPTSLGKSKKREAKATLKKGKPKATEDKIKQPKAKKKVSAAITKKKAEENLKSEKLKEQNKERAQKSRNRKNLYTRDLEDKVEQLQSQVKDLTFEVDKYKKLLKKQLFQPDVQNDTEDQSILEQILDSYKTTNDSSNFIKAHCQTVKKDGFTGENRLKTLDKAFDMLMEFLVPDTFWMAFYIMNELGDKSYYADVDKIRKIRNYSKYQFQEAYERKEINDNDMYWHTLKLTDEQSEIMNSQHHILKQGKEGYRDIIVRLNELRNDIIEKGKILDAYPYKVMHCLKKEQLVRKSILVF